MGAQAPDPDGRDSRVWVLLPENLNNRLPGLCALFIREEAPSPLPVGCLTDSLTQLTRKYRVMVSSGYHLILLISSAGGPDLPGIPFYLRVSYQACMDTPLTEVHPPGDPCPDIPGHADTQHICEENVGKDEGPLVNPGPPEYPPPFCSQYGREAAPYCARGRGVPAS